MVTTDGHRLAYIERALDTPLEGSMDALIPKKALLELVKISRDLGDDVSFGEDQNHIRLGRPPAYHPSCREFSKVRDGHDQGQRTTACSTGRNEGAVRRVAFGG